MAQQSVLRAYKGARKEIASYILRVTREGLMLKKTALEGSGH